VDFEQIVVIICAFATPIATVLSTRIGNNSKQAVESQKILDKIDSLEKAQNKHNKVIERTFILEKAVEVLEERQKVANNRIKDLEEICKR